VKLRELTSDIHDRRWLVLTSNTGHVAAVRFDNLRSTRKELINVAWAWSFDGLITWGELVAFAKRVEEEKLCI
jgi:hypothetical protein